MTTVRVFDGSGVDDRQDDTLPSRQQGVAAPAVCFFRDGQRGGRRDDARVSAVGGGRAGGVLATLSASTWLDSVGR